MSEEVIQLASRKEAIVLAFMEKIVAELDRMPHARGGRKEIIAEAAKRAASKNSRPSELELKIVIDFLERELPAKMKKAEAFERGGDRKDIGRFLRRAGLDTDPVTVKFFELFQKAGREE